MRPALAILKWVPAVVCGLLVVAWVASDMNPFGFEVPVISSGHNSYETVVVLLHGSIEITRAQYDYPAWWPVPCDQFGLLSPGELKSERFRTTETVRIPIPFLLSLLAPVCVSFFRRFPLWSYFAYTALIAAELAYYLQ